MFTLFAIACAVDEFPTGRSSRDDDDDDGLPSERAIVCGVADARFVADAADATRVAPPPPPPRWRPRPRPPRSRRDGSVL
jgi:hypothetical protein